jgi:hypothetical protein
MFISTFSKFIQRVFTGAVIYYACSAAPVFGAPFYIVQKDIRYLQTSTAAPTTSNGFDMFLTVTTPGTFDGGTVMTPGSAGTETLSPVGSNLQFGSGVLSDGSAFPTGNYLFHLTDSTNPASTADQTVDDNVERFSSVIPALTPASWNALQTIDPTMPFTFHFNTFMTSDAPLTFFAIVNQSDNSIPVFDSLQPNVGQDTVAANTLQNGTPYRFIIFFSNNIDTTNTQVQLNSRTQGFFTPSGNLTATPEPASISMCLIGGAAMLGALRRRRV